MISRTRFLITPALLCHLLLAPPLVTSQLRSDQVSSPRPGTVVVSGPSTDEVRVSANTQEMEGRTFKLRGAAEVRYRTYILYADEITYNADTGETTVDGNVVLDGGPYDEHIRASNGTYNVRT